MLSIFAPLAAALIATRTAYATHAIAYRFSHDCGLTDDATSKSLNDFQLRECRNWEEDGEFLDMASVSFDILRECPNGTSPQGFVFQTEDCRGNWFSVDVSPIPENDSGVCSQPTSVFLSVGVGCCGGEIDPKNCGYAD